MTRTRPIIQVIPTQSYSYGNPPGLNGANVWDPRRAIAAFHVYVHLALFCTVAEQRAAELESIYGRVDALPTMTKSRIAFERAHYLGENRRIRVLARTRAGRAANGGVAKFHTPMLWILYSTSTRFHIFTWYWSRYLKETSKKSSSNPLLLAVQRNWRPLSETRQQFTQTLLQLLGAQAEAEELSINLAKFSNFEDASTFSQVRRFIAATLLKLAPDGYTSTFPLVGFLECVRTRW